MGADQHVRHMYNPHFHMQDSYCHMFNLHCVTLSAERKDMAMGVSSYSVQQAEGHAMHTDNTWKPVEAGKETRELRLLNWLPCTAGG